MLLALNDIDPLPALGKKVTAPEPTDIKQAQYLAFERNTGYDWRLEVVEQAHALRALVEAAPKTPACTVFWHEMGNGLSIGRLIDAYDWEGDCLTSL